MHWHTAATHYMLPRHFIYYDYLPTNSPEIISLAMSYRLFIIYVPIPPPLSSFTALSPSLIFSILPSPIRILASHLEADLLTRSLTHTLVCQLPSLFNGTCTTSSATATPHSAPVDMAISRAVEAARFTSPGPLDMRYFDCWCLVIFKVFDIYIRCFGDFGWLLPRCLRWLPPALSFDILHLHDYITLKPRDFIRSLQHFIITRHFT